MLWERRFGFLVKEKSLYIYSCYIRLHILFHHYRVTIFPLLLGAHLTLAKATHGQSMQTQQEVASHLPRDPHEFLPSYQRPPGHNPVRARVPMRSWIGTQSNASATRKLVQAAVRSPKNGRCGGYEGRARDLQDGVHRSPGLLSEQGKEGKNAAHHVDWSDELSHGVLDHIHDARVRTPT